MGVAIYASLELLYLEQVILRTLERLPMEHVRSSALHGDNKSMLPIYSVCQV